ncbi:MAG: outer membrane beta-barrel protein [Gammaproteobacteria bacterium]
MTARFARSPLARLPLNASPVAPSSAGSTGVAALPRPASARHARVAALACLSGAALLAPALASAADDWSGGPRYSYFDTGYQWVDSNYGVKQEGGQHEGFRLNGSVGLAQFGRVGLHLFGEFFDGDFTGTSASCDGGEGATSFTGDRDSQSLAGGLGASIAVAESTDVVVQLGYVDITEFQTPNNLCELVSGDDTGYLGEVIVRSELSENVEIEAGFRYSDLDDSNVSSNDVLLGLGYHLTDYLTLRARGVVFDDDTGIEISARLYFGNFLGRDTIF